MKIAIIALTTGGHKLAEAISKSINDSFVDTRTMSIFNKMAALWESDVGCIVCIMATGIVVRAVAPLCKEKKHDPCIIVLDEKGEFVISLLSGHIGGGNELSRKIAAKLGAQAVITTASDVTGHTALDLWAKKNKVLVTDNKKLTQLSAKIVNNGSISIYTDCDVDKLPPDIVQIAAPDDADIIVSNKIFKNCNALLLRPCNICIGIGCNRGTSAYDFKTAITELLTEYQISYDSVKCYASIDLKSDETGMLEFVNQEQRPIHFYTKDALNSVDGVSSSFAVMKATGAKGVAEPASILAAQTNESSSELIVRKHKWKDVTAAIAEIRICLQV